MRTITFGSLFAGIGGFDLGFERAGLVVKWQVEIDDYANRVLKKHWPTVTRWRDVQTFPPEHGDWKVDVICGGDPCQANSAAVGSGSSVHESLGGEFIRVIDALRPKIVVRENPSHARKNASWPWWRFRSELESIGYACLPFRLRACCFGALHQRDRVFVLGVHSDSYGERLAWREAEEKRRITSQPEGRIHPGYWPALHAPRRIRSRRGFPNYVDRMRGVGNAVHPGVSEWIGKRIVEALNDSVTDAD